MASEINWIHLITEISTLTSEMRNRLKCLKDNIKFKCTFARKKEDTKIVFVPLYSTIWCLIEMRTT